MATSLAAQPVSRICDYKGEGKFGPLQVSFDEASRSVTVTTGDGQVWRYQDGATGPINPYSAKDDLGPVEQFVKLSPDRVEVGFRWSYDGSTAHLSYFDPASFRIPPSVACGVRCGTSGPASGGRALVQGHSRAGPSLIRWIWNSPRPHHCAWLRDAAERESFAKR